MTFSFILTESYYGQEEGRSTIPKTFAYYTLTDAHYLASDGTPVLVGSEGTVYGPKDILPNGMPAWWEVEHANWHDATPEEISLVKKFVSSCRIER